MVADVHEQAIGIVGVGNMGRGVAESILRRGYSLHVYDTNSDAVAELVALGAIEARSLTSLAAEADVICIVVVNDEQVTQVGTTILEHCRPGTAVLVHSTVRPSIVRSLAASAQPLGANVLDVCMSGGSEKAARGMLTLMIGGDEETARRLWPLFEAIGEHVFYMGPVGSGGVAKLINNLITIGSYALQVEGMRLGAGFGLDEDAIATAVIAGQGDSRGMRMWGRYDRNRSLRAARGIDGAGRMARDLHEAAQAGDEVGIELSITAMIADRIGSILHQRDLELAARPSNDGWSIPRCVHCGQELAAPFREVRRHPECNHDTDDH